MTCELLDVRLVLIVYRSIVLKKISLELHGAYNVLAISWQDDQMRIFPNLPPLFASQEACKQFSVFCNILT